MTYDIYWFTNVELHLCLLIVMYDLFDVVWFGFSNTLLEFVLLCSSRLWICSFLFIFSLYSVLIAKWCWPLQFWNHLKSISVTSALSVLFNSVVNRSCLGLFLLVGHMYPEIHLFFHCFQFIRNSFFFFYNCLYFSDVGRNVSVLIAFYLFYCSLFSFINPAKSLHIFFTF